MIKVSVEEFFINLRNKENLKRYRYVFMGMKGISLTGILF